MAELIGDLNSLVANSIINITQTKSQPEQNYYFQNYLQSFICGEFIYMDDRLSLLWTSVNNFYSVT